MFIAIILEIYQEQKNAIAKKKQRVKSPLILWSVLSDSDFYHNLQKIPVLSGATPLSKEDIMGYDIPENIAEQMIQRYGTEVKKESNSHEE